MKKILVMALVLMFGLVLGMNVFAADKDAIKAQVDGVVAGLNGSKTADDYKDLAKSDPYIFIMKEDGQMLVHPSLTGKNIKGGDMDVIYKEVSKATDDGTWVKYQWQGKEKNTYVKKAKGGLIVGSGY